MRRSDYAFLRYLSYNCSQASVDSQVRVDSDSNYMAVLIF